MELKRISGEGGIRWVVGGDMDDDSLLSFESIISNSMDWGSDITLDVSGLRSLPGMGARGMGLIARKLHDNGSSLRIVGAKGAVRERLKTAGLLQDQ